MIRSRIGVEPPSGFVHELYWGRIVRGALSSPIESVA